MDNVDQMFELVLRGRFLESVSIALFLLGAFVATAAFIVGCVIDSQYDRYNADVRKEKMPRLMRVTKIAIAAVSLCWLLSAAGCCASAMYPGGKDLETIGTYKAVKEACSSDMFKAFVESVMDSNVVNRGSSAEDGGK